MTKPVRIQRKRTKGYNMQEHSRAINGLDAVYVGRPSRWGNPYVVGKDGDANECVRKYAEELCPYTHHGGNLEDFYVSEANLTDIEQSLKGKNLACFCALDQPCHADLLLKWANL